MKEVYKKTITTIFIAPTLQIDRSFLDENNFINAYLGDIDNDLYHEEDAVFLLFKPKDKLAFNSFLEKERERTENLLDDYDHDNGYVVVVYLLNKDYEADFGLIRNSKYSQTSKEFQKLFPEKVKDYSNLKGRMLPSLQHMVFNKDERLRTYWENELGTSIISRKNLEIWPGFDERKEILDIDLIKEQDNERNSK
jgi:hypothetical protein